LKNEKGEIVSSFLNMISYIAFLPAASMSIEQSRSHEMTECLKLVRTAGRNDFSYCVLAR